MLSTSRCSRNSETLCVGRLPAAPLTSTLAGGISCYSSLELRLRWKFGRWFRCFLPNLRAELFHLTTVRIGNSPAAIHFDTIQPAGHTRRPCIGNKPHIWRDNPQGVAGDCGAKHIFAHYARSEVDIHPALDPQPTNRLSTFPDDHLILRSAVEDVVVDHRDVGNVLRLSDDGDILARRYHHSGEAG